MLKLVKSPEGFRIGNIVFVDHMVFPPNFITAEPLALSEGFEPLLNEKTNNVACFNAEGNWMDLFLEIIKQNNEGTGSIAFKLENPFEIEKVQESAINQFPIWKISHRDRSTNISFIHELQNYYEDWIGIKLYNF